MDKDTSTPKKLIEDYNNGQITLKVKANSREQAWTELTNVGATVTNCSKLILSDNMAAKGKLDGGLVQIEQLERKGWTWG